MKRFYVVHTKPNQENKAKRNLEFQGFKTWLPIYKKAIQRKKGLVDGISSVLKDILNIDPKDVYCIFRETPAHNHYTGGEPLPDWVPADK